MSSHGGIRTTGDGPVPHQPNWIKGDFSPCKPTPSLAPQNGAMSAISDLVAASQYCGTMAGDRITPHAYAVALEQSQDSQRDAERALPYVYYEMVPWWCHFA